MDVSRLAALAERIDICGDCGLPVKCARRLSADAHAANGPEVLEDLGRSAAPDGWCGFRADSARQSCV